jgi:mannosyltransferase
MSTPAIRAARSRAPQRAVGGRDGYAAGPRWMWALPPMVMLGLSLWKISGPSYWRDEAATLTAVHRTFPQLLRMLGHVDAVHGVYYMIIWPLVRAFGAAEVVTRLPSVLAMTAAAAAVAALGRRLVSPAAGLAAGLVFAVLPQISRYAQDARSYALVTALGTTATYLLVRAISTGGRRRGWLTGYAVCMGVMGALNIFGVLLIAAHAVTVALACLRGEDGRIRMSLAGLRGQQAGSARSLALGWLAAVAGALALASPILALGIAQRDTASWIRPPGPATLRRLAQLVGPPPMVIAAVLIVAIGLAVMARSGRAGLRAAWPPRLAALTAPWLMLPPALLIGVSFSLPLFVPRYILYCLPALALLVGAGLAALGRVAGMAAFAALALLGLTAQLAIRSPGGHGDNIRAVDRIIAAQRQPGDAVLYTNKDANYFTAAYPYGLAQLDNIGRDKSGAQLGRLVQTTVPDAVLRQRLRGVSRLWFIDASTYPKSPVLSEIRARRLGAWQVGRIWLVLYQQTRA